MKMTFLAIVLLFAFANCKTISHVYKSKQLTGQYTPEDSSYETLVLNSNSAFLYYSLPDHHGQPGLSPSDTIAYGNWSIESNGWLAFSSPSLLLKKLKITADENSNSNADTVYIKINSPFQEDLSHHILEPKIAAYAACVEVMNAFLEQLYPSSTSNVIKLYNPKKLPILSISLVIYPESHYFDFFIPSNYTEGVTAGMTESYRVRNPASNQFVIIIPDLTEGFLSHRRLNRDFIKIVDENHLEWDGRIFKKK